MHSLSDLTAVSDRYGLSAIPFEWPRPSGSRSDGGGKNPSQTLDPFVDILQ